jgi:hypothetical protein
VLGDLCWPGSRPHTTRLDRRLLELPTEDVAIALGHTDGGELVRKLYGHRDRERALDRVTAAYERTASHTQMRFV